MSRSVHIALIALCALPASLSAQDYDGDGYADLAIGVPSEDVGSAANAGAVMVLYGSASGITSVGDQFWHADSTGVPGTAGANEAFGTALAHGDFNGDGFTDLAIGAPGDSIGRPPLTGAGTVTVLLGSASGLTATGCQVWSQDSTEIADTAEESDRFGTALCSGDFNGDGYADLAVGAPQEDVTSPFSTVSNAGAVSVLYGSAAGLSSAGNQFWSENSGGIDNSCESGDGFGQTLVSGDIDGNGCDDLVVGVPFEDQGPTLNAGLVHVIYGTTAGLSATNDEIWYQASESVPDDPGAFDSFGEVLAAGDFDHDGYADLALGVPHEDTGEGIDAGVVFVLFGDATGLSTVGANLFRQSMFLDTFVLLDAEPYELFGCALAAGDFSGGGFDDLAIGTRNEKIYPSNVVGGSVEIVYGSGLGLYLQGTQHWTQNNTGVDSSEAYDHFGMTLACGDFRGDGTAALAVGVPDEDLGTAANCGAVQILYSDGLRLSATGSQLWSQNSFWVEDSSESGDRMGAGL